MRFLIRSAHQMLFGDQMKEDERKALPGGNSSRILSSTFKMLSFRSRPIHGGNVSKSF